MELPSSMDNCVYFTRRAHKNGLIIAWVERESCPACKKSLMGKPVDNKGKVKIRSTEYSCKSCGNTIAKEEYESSLTARIIYDCPHCGKHGEIQVPFKRKKARITDEEAGKVKSVEVLRFACQHCKKDIDVTKKMK